MKTLRDTIWIEGTEIPQLSFLGIVEYENWSKRMDSGTFFDQLAEVAFDLGWIKKKEYGIINYWYDGPMGNQALELYENGVIQEAKDGIIAITRVLCGYEQHELLIKIVKTLQENGNLVLLYPQEIKECGYYEGLLRSANLIFIENDEKVV